MPREFLSHKINSLTSDSEALQYEKAFLTDFFDKQSTRLNLVTLQPIYQTARAEVAKAVDSGQLQAIVVKFTDSCRKWKGEWVERGAKDKVLELAWQADKLALTLLNMPLYGDYSINLHYQQPIASTSTPFHTFATGLPTPFIAAVTRDPRFAITYTSGSYLNNYGHALLFCGEAGFIHINAPTSLPRHMSIQQFNRYLKDEEKVLLGMMGTSVNKVNALIVHLNGMCQKKWTWFAVVHNCLTFTHEALKAGGYHVAEQAEFKRHTLKLPTKHLNTTKEQDLILAKKVSIPLRHFEPRSLATHAVDTLPVLENFHPDSIEQFVNYISEHPVKVLRQQGALANAGATHDETRADHVLIGMQKIVAVLNHLKKHLETDYQILFVDKMQCQRILVKIPQIKTILKENLARAIIKNKITSVRMGLFAKSAISEQAVTVNQLDRP